MSMKRPLSIVLADAFDRAAHDVFVAPQVHKAEGDPAPSRWDLWVYWSRGFAAGLVNDDHSMPLWERIFKRPRRSEPDVCEQVPIQSRSQNWIPTIGSGSASDQ